MADPRLLPVPPDDGYGPLRKMVAYVESAASADAEIFIGSDIAALLRRLLQERDDLTAKNAQLASALLNCDEAHRARARSPHQKPTDR